jgi:hypothetical protein
MIFSFFHFLHLPHHWCHSILFPQITCQPFAWPMFSAGEPVDGILRACAQNTQRAAPWEQQGTQGVPCTLRDTGAPPALSPLHTLRDKHPRTWIHIEPARSAFHNMLHNDFVRPLRTQKSSRIAVTFAQHCSVMTRSFRAFHRSLF